MNDNSKQRIFGLDLMRAIAITMVLCSHILWIYPSKNRFISNIFEMFGLWGVEIFFVLSGFLIGGILYKTYTTTNFSINEIFIFLKRRWFRTLPNYYLVLIINIVVATYIGYEMESLWRYFFFLQNFSSTMLPFFPESWSLSVEEFTYLLVPIVLFCSLKIKVKNKSIRFLSVIIILILFFLITKIVYAVTTDNSSMTQWNLSLKSVVIYRIDAILIGFLMFWISYNYKVFWEKHKKLFFLIGCALMGFIFLGIGTLRILIDTNPYFWNIFYLPLNSICFAMFLPVLSQWKTSKSIYVKPVQFISLISYSIYLIHYCIIMQLMKHWIDTSSFSNIQLHMFTIVYLLVTITASFLLYKFYEKPMTNLRENKI